MKKQRILKSTARSVSRKKQHPIAHLLNTLAGRPHRRRRRRRRIKFLRCLFSSLLVSFAPTLQYMQWFFYLEESSHGRKLSESMAIYGSNTGANWSKYVTTSLTRSLVTYYPVYRFTFARAHKFTNISYDLLIKSPVLKTAPYPRPSLINLSLLATKGLGSYIFCNEGTRQDGLCVTGCTATFRAPAERRSAAKK
jgi:hypothetical protein